VSALLTLDIAQFFAIVRQNALNHVDIWSQGNFGMCSMLLPCFVPRYLF